MYATAVRGGSHLLGLLLPPLLLLVLPLLLPWPLLEEVACLAKTERAKKVAASKGALHASANPNQ